MQVCFLNSITFLAVLIINCAAFACSVVPEPINNVRKILNNGLKKGNITAIKKSKIYFNITVCGFFR